MPAQENRRSAIVNPPFLILISPQGTLRKVPIATNLKSPIVMLDGEEFVIRGGKRAAGWCFLSDHCKGAAFDKVEAHLKAEESNPFGVEPLDEKLLPKICKERLAKAVQASTPKVPQSTDSSEVKRLRAELDELKALIKGQSEAKG